MTIIYLQETISYLASKGLDIKPIIESGVVCEGEVNYVKITVL
jgi:hypothetical protein